MGKRYGYSILLKFGCLAALSIISYIFFPFASMLQAQQLIIRNYGVKDGLPTFFTKSIVQDKTGYIYIASDQGVTFYNGRQFITYNQQLPSTYVKYLYKDRNESIIAVTDGGLVRIQKKEDALRFKLLVPSTQNLNDTTLHFPKSIYQDTNLNYWISEPNSLTHLSREGKILNRYTFPPKDRTTSYAESFMVFELDQQMLTVSQKGTFYHFNNSQNEFTAFTNQPFSDRSTQINDVKKIGPKNAFVATNHGLYHVKYQAGTLSCKKLPGTHNITAVTTYEDSQILFADDQSHIYRLNLQDPDKNFKLVLKSGLLNINQLYEGAFNTIWASSDEGIALLFNPPISSIPFPEGSQFTRALTIGVQNTLYVANDHLGYSIESGRESRMNKIFSLENDLIRTIAVSEDGQLLWTGSQNGHLYKYKEGSLTSETVPFMPYGISTSIIRLFTDSVRNLWIIREEFPGVIQRKPDGTYNYFGPEHGLNSQLSDIAQVDSNTLYFGGETPGGYLYSYDYSEQQFNDLSPKITGSMTENSISVFDITVAPNHDIYLATNRGIFKTQDGNLLKISLPENIPNALLRSVEATPNGDLWIGLENGLLVYENEGYLRHFPHLGNSRKLSVEYRSLHADTSGTLWIGTIHNGVNQMKWSQKQNTVKTPTPIFNDVTVAGKEVSLSEDISMVKNQRIEINYHSIIYPSELISYQWRIPEMTEKWSHYSFDNTLTQSNLPVGTYSLQIRALHNSFQPSEISTLTFTVQQYWFLRWPYLFIFGIIIAGLVLGFVTFYKESVRRRLAQNRLRKTENQLQAIISNTPVIIFAINTEGFVTICDGEGLKRLGLTSSDFVGKHYKAIFREAYYRQKIEDAMQGQEVKYQRTINENTFSIRLHPVTDDEGNIIQIIGISIDISDRVQMEHQLLRAKNAAEKASNAKSKFLANMSHELRTPLNAILGYAQILKRKIGADPQVQNQIDVMYKSGNHLLNMINEILDLSKIESGAINIQTSTVHIKPFMNDIVNMLNPEIEKKGLFLDLIFDFGGDEVIVTDKNKLRQIIINLVKNAISYTHEGSITILVVTGYENKPNINISICDTGPGISDDEIDHIFEPFKQTERAEAHNIGTGLGLSITKNLVEKLEGSINISSNMGEQSGTCFDILIPYTKPDQHSRQKPDEEDTFANNFPHLTIPKKVLIADDVPENLDIVDNLMKDVGFTTILAKDGKEAVEKYLTHKPDLIILDIVMPRLNGKEVFNEIKSKSKHTAPIIALTASGFDSSKQELLDMGFNAYFRKPFKEKKLLKCVVDLTGKQYFTYEQHTNQSESEHDGTVQSLHEIFDFLYTTLDESEFIKFRDSLDLMEWNQMQNILSKYDTSGLPAVNKLKTALNQTNFRFLLELNEIFEQRSYESGKT